MPFNLCHTSNTSGHCALLRKRGGARHWEPRQWVQTSSLDIRPSGRKVFVERALLLEESQILFEQNNILDDPVAKQL
ncbi:uncharacterized protein N7469_002569 [Penicillium citrinum]|uniref:Uncharacterized protein n=1 Tax=Penicillium citrinum TaxID=5077 RepID=A0A9W9PAL5_PENCI|nr:uncharacterized protein N7469_002569 [Penicillium citrinum]KAJ5240978.1 hypothetical protein N7469_002569 [Penicillium citrinum]